MYYLFDSLNSKKKINPVNRPERTHPALQVCRATCEALTREMRDCYFCVKATEARQGELNVTELFKFLKIKSKARKKEILKPNLFQKGVNHLFFFRGCLNIAEFVILQILNALFKCARL